MAFLDNAGLAHFTTWVKGRLSGKQDALTPDASIKLQGGDIAVSLPTMTVTKAEYEALTEEQRQAEVLYAVTDDAGGSGGGSCEEAYSTEETRIGTWIDGKPLYRKVVENTGLNAYNTWVEIAVIPDIDQMVFAYGSVLTSDQAGTLAIPNMRTAIKLENPNKIVYTAESQNMSGKTIRTIVLYTKTTDEAGEEVPGGGGSSAGETYSTEEARIGTWIDGKPLYRRTFQTSHGAIANKAWQNCGVIQDLDYGMIVRGTVMELTGESILNLQSSVFRTRIKKDGGIVEFYTENFSSSSGAVSCVTVEYTKTTDEGGTA